METNFSVDGYWWDPSKPDKKYGGVLEYQRDSYTRLRLFGTMIDWLRGEFLKEKINTIHGVATNGEKYTLLNNIIESSTISLKPSGGYSIIRVKYLLEGYHFKSYDDVVLDSVSCNLSNLDNWLNIDSFNRLSNPEERSIKLTVKPTWEFKTYIESINSKIEISFENRVNIKNNKISFIGIPFIKIEPEKKQNLDLFLGKIHDLKNLFTLFVNEPSKTNILTAELTIPVGDSKNDSKITNIFFNDRTSAKEIEIYKMLIPSYLISEKLDDVLEKWFQINNEIRPMINTFLASYYNPQDYLETRLLNCTYAAEGIHKKMKSIEKSISLRDTLKYILSNIDKKYYLLFIKDKISFIQDIINQRNFLIHNQHPKKELSFHQFFLLTYRFQLFVHLKILNLIGISYDNIFQNIKKSGLFSNLWLQNDES